MLVELGLIVEQLCDEKKNRVRVNNFVQKEENKQVEISATSFAAAVSEIFATVISYDNPKYVLSVDANLVIDIFDEHKSRKVTSNSLLPWPSSPLFQWLIILSRREVSLHRL